MTRLFRQAILIAALFGGHAAGIAAALQPAPVPVDAVWLDSHGIRIQNVLVAAQRISDDQGQHVLVLERHAGPSPSRPRSGRVEKIDLLATFYREAGTGHWEQEWTIRDGTDCPNLDASADFFPSQVTFTDLNKDGHVEVTVPYRTFCGGGVDPYTIKVILREGQTKLAVRGESRVSGAGIEPFGGEHKFDDALQSPSRAAYKRHLEQVWDKVSVDKR